MKKIIIVLILMMNNIYSQSSLEKLNPFDWNKTSFEISVNAEFDISKYKTILIAEVLNSDNELDSHASDIYDELTTSILKLGNIEIIDRKKTELLLNEMKFQASGLVDEDTMIKLGEFKGSGLLMVCRIHHDEFSDNVSESAFGIGTSLVNVDKNCKTLNTRKARYDISFNLKMIDLESTKIIYSKTLKATSEDKTKGYCQDPPIISPIDLYEKCLTDLAIQNRKLFTTHSKSVMLKFQKSSKFNEQLKNAITYFNINEFETGYTILKEIPESQSKPKVKSAALYNLALVQFYKNDFENSLKNAKSAYILNPSNQECLNVINELKKKGVE